MKRLVIVGCLLTLLACASTPQDSGRVTYTPSQRGLPAPEVELLVDVPSALALVRESDIAAHPLSGNADELWPRLVHIFQDLELPITALGSESRIVGTQNERLRRIGRQPISRYFECPGTAYGNTASTQPVTVTVVAQLIPAGNGTELRLATAASARPTGGSESRCRSTGVIERRIREALASAGASAVS